MQIIKGIPIQVHSQYDSLEEYCKDYVVEELQPDRDTFPMYGAVISRKGNVYMFTAPSGTGKSTHISLWRKYLGEGVQSINGDKQFRFVSDTEVRAYGP